MPTITTAGETIYYYHRKGDHRKGDHQKGDAATPPLVLVHGAGGNYLHWPGELRRLPGHEVYALDLPGHGKSAGRGRSSVADYAEAVRAFVETLGLQEFVLGGHSMGGAIVLEYALSNPEHLEGLILVATGARLRVAPQILEGILSDFEGTTALMTQWAHGPGTSARELGEYTRRLRQVPAEVIHADYAACDEFDRRGDIGRIQVPALVICGTEDRLTPPKYSEWLVRELPDAELVLVPGAGHMLMLEPGRMMAVAAIAAFLERKVAQHRSGVVRPSAPDD